MKPGTPESRAEAQRRIESALRRIQEAQAEIGRAQAEISNIIPMANDYTRLGKLYDRIRAEWYRVAKRRHSKGVDLDGIAIAAITRAEAEVTP